MNRALLDKETGAVLPYPRLGDEPVVGLDPRYSVLTIVRAAEPDYDAETQQLIPTRAVVGDEWRWGWMVEELPAPPEPGPDYLNFYGGLLSSQLYQGVVGSTGKSGDQAAAMVVFLGVIHDALSGRVNEAAFQAAIWLLLSQIQLTTEGLAELLALMDEHRLSGVYSLSPGVS
jgi:hypothetical protein